MELARRYQNGIPRPHFLLTVIGTKHTPPGEHVYTLLAVRVGMRFTRWIVGC